MDDVDADPPDGSSHSPGQPFPVLGYGVFVTALLTSCLVSFHQGWMDMETCVMVFGVVLVLGITLHCCVRHVSSHDDGDVYPSREWRAHFDFDSCVAVTMVYGGAGHATFALPRGIALMDTAAPWMGLHTLSGDIVGDGGSWYQCKASRAAGFLWEASFVPPPGVYVLGLFEQDGDFGNALATLDVRVI